MTVYADQLISGTGQIDFNVGARIEFALIHVTDFGSLTGIGEEADRTLHLGYIAWGAEADSIDSTFRTYWSKPIWIEWENFLWHPEPTIETPPNDFAVWASHVRWFMRGGSEAYLYVVGV